MASMLDQLKNWGRVKRDIERAGARRVLVGAPDTPNGIGDITNGALLILHEYGTASIPSRPVLRMAIEQNAEALIEGLRKDLAAALSGKGAMTVDKAYQRLALRLEAEVKKLFGDGSLAPLQAETIAAKGSSAPLIDTGDLRASIEGIVVDLDEVAAYTGEEGE